MYENLELTPEEQMWLFAIEEGARLADEAALRMQQELEEQND